MDSSLVTNLSNSDLFGFTYEDSSGVVSSELYGNTAVASVTFSPQIVLTKIAPVIDKSTALAASGTVDNDGDSVNDLVANSPTGLTVKWFYNNAGVDTVFTPSATDSFCSIYLLNNFKGPYKLEISGDLDLKTQYGDPILTTYASPTPTKIYTLNPTIDGASCVHLYAQPNNFAYGTGGFSGGGYWGPLYGFLKRNLADDNFPSTGFYNAKFAMAPLVIGNGASIDSQYSWSIVSQPGALLTINGNQITFNGSEAGNVVAAYNRVLGGYPVKIKGIHPESIFNVEYEFNLRRWFVTNGSASDFFSGEAWCKNLAGAKSYLYRLALPLELSNSNRIGGDASHDGYSRKVGPLFSEWGATFDSNLLTPPAGAGNGYVGSGFLWSDFWTYAPVDGVRMHTISSPYGNNQYREVSSYSLPTVCVSDPSPVAFVDYAAPSDISAATGWDPNRGDATNGFMYKSNSMYFENFPSRAYAGLEFQLIVGTKAANSASTYNWSVISQEGNIITVDGNGVVRFNGADTGNTWTMKHYIQDWAGFHIRGTKAGALPVDYRFVLRNWFTISQTYSTFVDASNICSSIGYRLPEVNDVTSATTTGVQAVRTFGNLTSEWLRSGGYGAGYIPNQTWTNTPANANGSQRYVFSGDGNLSIRNALSGAAGATACVIP